MNFNILFLLISMVIFSSCGVKSAPVHPKGTDLPSYIDQVLEETEIKTKSNSEKSDNKKQTKKK